MERLIADAAKLSDTVDAQSLSFANIVEAIHVVQKDLGITGATFEEAKKTISGSVSAMKASWSNLVTAVANDNADFEKYVEQFTSSVATVGQNILPRIRIALEGAGQLVDELFPIIIEEIPLIIEENLPILSDAAVGIIESLISGISKNSEGLFSTFSRTIVELASAGLSMLPEIIKLGGVLLISLANGIVQSLPELTDATVETIRQLTEMLTDQEQLDKFVDVALELIVALSEALAEVAPELVEGVLKVITALCDYFIDTENLKKIGGAATDIIVALGRGLIESVGNLFANVGELCTTIGNKIRETDWKGVGKDIVTSILDGLKNAWSDLGDWFTDSWDKLADGVKDLFGFKDDADGSHAGGLTYVPRSGYKAVLHQGEMVLTESQANAYRNGQTQNAVAYSAETPVEVTMQVGEVEFGKLIFSLNQNRQFINGYNAAEVL